MYYTHIYFVFRFMCKVDYDNAKFVYAPTFTYNEVMWLHELANFVKCK